LPLRPSKSQPIQQKINKFTTFAIREVILEKIPGPKRLGIFGVRRYNTGKREEMKERGFSK